MQVEIHHRTRCTLGDGVDLKCKPCPSACFVFFWQPHVLGNTNDGKVKKNPSQPRCCLAWARGNFPSCNCPTTKNLCAAKRKYVQCAGHWYHHHTTRMSAVPSIVYPLPDIGQLRVTPSVLDFFEVILDFFGLTNLFQFSMRVSHFSLYLIWVFFFLFSTFLFRAETVQVQEPRTTPSPSMYAASGVAI